MIPYIHANANISWAFQIAIALLALLVLRWYRQRHHPLAAMTPFDRTLAKLIPAFGIGFFLLLLFAIFLSRF